MSRFDLYGNPTGEDEIMSREGEPPVLPDAPEYGSAGAADAPTIQSILAGMPPGFNRSPDVGAPDFHQFVGDLMDQGQMRPGAEAVDAFEQRVKPLYAHETAAPQRKIQPLEAILGGLTEALSTYSHLRKGPHMKYRLLGRHGEKYMSGGRAEAPHSDAPPVGSTLMNMLAAPSLEHRAEERRLAPINAAKDVAYAKAMADFTGRAMAPPKPPPESPILSGYRAWKQIQDSGAPGTENAAVNWIRHATNPTPQTKQTITEQVATLRAQGNKDAADALVQAEKDVAAARRGPPKPAAAKLSPEDKEWASHERDVQRQADRSAADYQTTLRQRLNDTQAEVKRLESERLTLATTSTIAMDDAAKAALQLRIKELDDRLRQQRNLAAVLDKQVGAGQSYRMAPQWNAEGAYTEQAAPAGEDTFGNMEPDIHAFMPEGVDPNTLTLSNGFPASHYTPDILKKMHPEELADLQDEISRATAGGQ